ncbi:MAG TPA: fumarylacetoacetate hydrolase family protein [Acidimicrobiia bacterium]|nr:fumarylacetoacetate hydrolase family protein [Acidimicrobiia bacterium]
MKLARCAHDGDVWWGSVEGEEVRLLALAGQAPIATWSAGARRARHAHPLGVVALDEVVLLNPVPDPSKVICVGLNYHDHAAESGTTIPDTPLVFAKFPSSLIGPRTPVILPDDSAQVDWEVELALVIGNPARQVPESGALDVIAGYTVSNDVSARDLQLSDGQFVRAKSYDTFCPVGPWLVTVDELGAADDLGIGLRLNGETMQDSRTSQLAFGVAEIVAFCSRVATLNPGDLILTGTPHGTGYGLDPQRFLSPGDEMTAWVEGIGELTNPVIAS